MSTSQRAVLEVRTPKDALETPEAMIQFLASLSHILKTSWWKNLTRTQPTITLEIASLKQLVYYIVTVDKQYEDLVKSQISAQYPTAKITAMDDYLPAWSKHGFQAVGQLKLVKPTFFPIKTYTSFATTDPMTSILGILGKTPPNTALIIQIILAKAPSKWGSAGRLVLKKGIGSDPLKFEAHPQKAIIEEKLSHSAFWTGIRILGIGPDQATAYTIASQAAGAFGTYAMGEGNAFKFMRARNQQSLVEAIADRNFKYVPMNQFLNTPEIASLYHFPTNALSSLRNLAWGKTIKGEAPDNLPIAEGLTEDQKHEITFYGKTEYRNHEVMFGIKRPDRRRHVYALGKSGTGKSWLLANMAVSDMNNGMGYAVIDPHGDLVEEHILNYVPENRIKDVLYLDPSDSNNPFHMNPLEVKRAENKELIASGIVSIFQKIFYYSWGPRLEYILRNTIMTLVEVPGSTLLDIPPLLTNAKFRDKVVAMVPEDNLVLRAFWLKEYNEYPDKLRNEAIAPIMNKVGQFIGSPTIRSIISKPKSTLDLEDIMNSGKILLLNLSQGKLGEDNATLLGAMFITQFQQAAMARAYIPEDQRKDFFLYVDEFQNFATTSFIKILSEARKYRLGLVLANQYTAQLPEEIQKAIFGNVGTMMSFVVGAEDATRIMQEFGNLYTQEDLVNLDKFQIITKLSIDNRISNPFPAYTIPLPKEHTPNREKVIALSKEIAKQAEASVAGEEPLTLKWQRETQDSVDPKKNEGFNRGSGGQVKYNNSNNYGNRDQSFRRDDRPRDNRRFDNQRDQRPRFDDRNNRQDYRNNPGSHPQQKSFEQQTSANTPLNVSENTTEFKSVWDEPQTTTHDTQAGNLSHDNRPHEQRPITDHKPNFDRNRQQNNHHPRPQRTPLPDAFSNYLKDTPPSNSVSMTPPPITQKIVVEQATQPIKTNVTVAPQQPAPQVEVFRQEIPASIQQDQQQSKITPQNIGEQQTDNQI